MCPWCGFGVAYAVPVVMPSGVGMFVELVESDGWAREWQVHRTYCGARPPFEGVGDD